LKSGLMRYRVEVQEISSTPDALGQPTITWNTTQTVYAQIMPLTARELYFTKTVRPETTHRITLRYFAGLTSANRLKMGSRIFNIVGLINQDEMKRAWLVDAVEVP